MPYPTFLSAAEGDVRREREAQDDKWGEQNHPDGTGDSHARLVAEHARVMCQEAAKDGRTTWKHVMWEEVAEAFAEHDETKLRTELVQVATVAIAWVEAIDRRKAARNRANGPCPECDAPYIPTDGTP